VVLIAVNVLRADHLSFYGYHRKTSPAIDELAQNAYVFKNAYAQAGYTLPNMMSINTSLYPKSHGVLDVYKDRLSERVNTLAEILKFNGYRTAWFSMLDEPHLSHEAGFWRGFEHWGELGKTFEGRKGLLNWIKKNKKNRLFISMNIRSMHTPYIPLSKYKKVFLQGEKGALSENYGEIYRALYYKILELVEVPGSPMYGVFEEEELAYIYKNEPKGQYAQIKKSNFWESKIDEIRQLIPAEQRWRLGHTQVVAYNSQLDLSNPNNLKYFISLYDACLLGVDQEIVWPIIDVLKKNKIYDNTMIIITGDHGEAFGEHHILGHGKKYYDEVIHVPLIIKLPSSQTGRQIEDLVQSIDIMPTILDMLDIESPYYAQGKSLMPLMQNKSTTTLNKYVFGDNSVLAYLRSHKWKLIIDLDDIDLEIGEQDKLFDLENDPAEKNNLALIRSKQFNKLRNRIKNHLDTLPEYIDGKYAFPANIDKAHQERIKKTGYW
jgi:arylsulfatase A-like enzyme